jgi:hypothetical protein
LRRRCEPGPRPRGPPAHCSARLAKLTAQCAGPSMDSGDNPLRPDTAISVTSEGEAIGGSIPDVV